MDLKEWKALCGKSVKAGHAEYVSGDGIRLIPLADYDTVMLTSQRIGKELEEELRIKYEKRREMEKETNELFEHYAFTV
jgi:hypothetical protein